LRRINTVPRILVTDLDFDTCRIFGLCFSNLSLPRESAEFPDRKLSFKRTKTPFSDQ
jgi:hypothetical protein